MISYCLGQFSHLPVLCISEGKKEKACGCGQGVVFILMGRNTKISKQKLLRENKSIFKRRNLIIIMLFYHTNDAIELSLS